jgi:hypothetical protein
MVATLRICGRFVFLLRLLRYNAHGLICATALIHGCICELDGDLHYASQSASSSSMENDCIFVSVFVSDFIINSAYQPIMHRTLLEAVHFRLCRLNMRYLVTPDPTLNSYAVKCIAYVIPCPSRSGLYLSPFFFRSV